MLAEIRQTRLVFYQTVVAQAQRIDIAAERVTFTFSANQRALREMFEQHRAWLETLAQRLAGSKVVIAAVQEQTPAAQASDQSAADPADRKSALREQALADAGMQALLEVFPAEIRDVEEM